MRTGIEWWNAWTSCWDALVDVNSRRDHVEAE
jgi:hypothetical protein